MFLSCPKALRYTTDWYPYGHLQLNVTDTLHKGCMASNILQNKEYRKALYFAMWITGVTEACSAVENPFGSNCGSTFASSEFLLSGAAMLGNSCIYCVALWFSNWGNRTSFAHKYAAKNFPADCWESLTFHPSTQKFILTISTSVDHKNFGGGGDICHVDEIKK
jgi:hypothetical protein